MSDAPLPVVHAFVFCDQIIQEEGTGKKTLVGTWHNINPAELPYTHPSMSCYVEMTDAVGSYMFTLVLRRLKDGQVAARCELPEVQVGSPLGTAELVLSLRNVTFQQSGDYEAELSADDRIVTTRRFHVRQREGDE